MRSSRFLLFALLPALLGAQVAAPRPPSVQAGGEGLVQAKPDQARLNIGVVTQAATAEAAASANAAQLQAALEKLRTALGKSGEIETSGYTLTPNYQYPREGGQATINGYTASNAIQVTTNDLGGLGKLIDTVAQAGANRIQGLQFSVKDDTRYRAEALKAAVRAARANAEAMAAAMNLKLGRVLMLDQGAPETVRPIMREFAASAAAATPIQPGTVEVRANVTLTIELLQ